jgi:pimeloyl-ACP methyl ester carboxylesterase
MTSLPRSLPGLLLAPALAGCYYLQDATGPLETLRYPGEARSTPAEDLFVLLPGLGDYADTFERHGVVDLLRGEDFADVLPADVLAVNAHLGYYSNRSVLVRLREDIIEPARERGYRRIHLFGVSLGAFGSLLYLREHPDDVATVTLLAPYLGEEEFFLHLIDEDAEPPEEIVEENLWPWLVELPDDLRDRIWLGYAEGDKFARGQAALAARLAPSHVVTGPGEHLWTAWRGIWPELLRGVARDAGGRVATPDR